MSIFDNFAIFKNHKVATLIQSGEEISFFDRIYIMLTNRYLLN